MFVYKKYFFFGKIKMHECLLLNVNKTYEVKNLDHEKLEDVLGKITFVGAIPEFEAFAIGSFDSSHQEINPFCTNKKYFEEEVKGKIIIIGSDANGTAMNLDCEKLIKFIITSIE
jgi:hypothetical protein